MLRWLTRRLSSLLTSPCSVFAYGLLREWFSPGFGLFLCALSPSSSVSRGGMLMTILSLPEA